MLRQKNRKLFLAGLLLLTALAAAVYGSPGTQFTITITVVSVGPPQLTGIVLKDRTSGSTTYTNERTINVEALGVTGIATFMMISESPTFSGATPIAYKNPTTFQLSAGEGKKTVYYKLKDNVGNQSSVVFASITLDLTAPTASVKVAGLPLKPGDHIGQDTTFDIYLSDSSGLDLSSIKVLLDGKEVEYEVVSSTSTSVQIRYKAKDIEEGVHELVIQAKDKAGNLVEKKYPGLKVTVEPARIIGPIITSPTPFSPERDKVCKLVYNLNKDVEIKIYMYGSTGMFWARTYTAGVNGGKAGYNEIEFNGVSDMGWLLGRGIYVYRIIAEGHTIGTGRVIII